MVINCPACTTGFNLPEKHITAKGTKLRCSKCGHVFRVRRDSPDDEVEFFYKPEDEANNEENGTAAQVPEQEANEKTQFGVGAAAPADGEELDGDEASSDNPSTVELEPMSMLGGEASEGTGNKTNFGMPATDEKSKGGLFGSLSEDDPFPHAGGNLKDLFGGKKESAPKEKAAASSPASAPAPELDTSTQLGLANADAPTPQEEELKGQTQLGTGVVGSTETEPAPSQEPASEPAQPKVEPAVDLFDDEADAPAGEDPFGDAFGDDGLDIDSLSEGFDDSAEDDDEPILRPGQPGMALTGNSVAHDEPAIKEPVMESAGLQQSSSMTADFWDEQGGDMASGGLAEASFADGPSFDPERGIVDDSAPQPQQPQPAPQPAAPRAAAQPRRAAANATPQAARAVKTEDDWPSDIETIAAPHKIGGGGLQKVANLLLIVLVVMMGFLGLVATLNGGFLDFKQFGSMLGVAFSGEEYKPRQEWLPKEKPKPVPPKKDILRTQSVYAEVVPITKKSSVLVIRGQVKNLDQQEYIDIKLRGLLLNSKDKIIAEKEAPIGELIPNSKFDELSSMTELPDILPKHPKPLKVGETEPFTIVFDEIPNQVKEGEPILFRVEFAERVGAQDLK